VSDRQRARATSRGGQSNELGSRYRAGVAAYLAAHSLSSQPLQHIGLNDDPSTPVVIKVESDEAVDDLLCEMPVGRLLIQAKRACGIDRHFRATVDQWVAAVLEGTVGTTTNLVLATGRAKGFLRDLPGALSRRRNWNAQRPSPREQEALARLVEAVKDTLDASQLDVLLDAATVIELPVEDASDAAFREAARMLEGTVVRAGDGIAAMQALQRHFQNLGAMRWASDRDAWRRALRDASLELLEDAGGGWSARQSAVEREVDAYQSHLSSRLNVFPLDLLTNDLPPMEIEDLVSTYQVALPDQDKARSEGLAELCRRWGRAIVVGLPGSGKSMALEQVAASWASRDDAPVPIFVPLRSLLRRIDRAGRKITLARLVEHAVDPADRNDSILVPELVHRCEVGEAALLLDGLDECRGKAATVADAVADIVAALPDSTSVVLTTRKSALPAASKLRLPEVELIEPYRLESTLELLLDHVARHRVSEPDRRAWIRERSQRLEEVQLGTSQLLHVPLMAVLLTLLIAEERAPRHGIGRAQLLADMVKDSVKRWEANKSKSEPPESDLEAGMLLDAFSEIGHLLTATGDATRNGAEDAVAAQFVADWDRVPRAAAEAAEAAVSFWDDRVGVFVSLPPDGTLEPRSRMFVEIAEAMWVSRQAPSTIRDWVGDAAADRERRETILLAAGLRSEIVELLIDAAEPHNADAVALAADAMAGGVRVPLPAQRHIVDLVEARLSDEGAEVVRNAETDADESTFASIMQTIAVGQARRDGPIWPTARRLAQLPLDPALWDARDRIIDTLNSEEQRVLGHALSAVAQTTLRGSEPSEDEVRRMVALLRAPLPDEETRTVRVSRRHTVIEGPTWSPLSGFGDAIVGCVQWLPQLDDGLVRLALLAARHTTMGHTMAVDRLLVQRGHAATVAEANRKQFRRMAALLRDDPWDSMRPYYDLVAGAATPSALTLSQAWRLENLSALTNLLGLSDLGVGTLGQAFDRASAEMAFLVPLCARRAGLDVGTLAAEAKVAAAAHDRGADREVVGLLFVPPPPGVEVALRRTQFKGGTLSRLMKALCSGVELPFVLAVRVLLSAGDEAIAASVLNALGDVPPWHRSRATRLAVVLAVDQVGTTLALLSGSDAVARVAASGLIAELADQDPDERLRASLERVAASRDFSMRAALFEEITSETAEVDVEKLARLAQSEPDYWTCCDCGREQALSDLDCRACRTGTRPDLPERLRGRMPWYTHPI
jgi:NACHT domain